MNCVFFIEVRTKKKHKLQLTFSRNLTTTSTHFKKSRVLFKNYSTRGNGKN